MNTKHNQNNYFIYCRKSTEDDDRQILSLDSQEKALEDLGTRLSFKIVSKLRESKSAKTPANRPVFNEMISRIKKGEASGILCWKLDRLARNPDEAGIIIGMLQRGEIKHIKTPEKDYYPEDNSLLSYLEFGIANQYIRDLSVNVKRGLKTKIEMGWRPGRAPLGYLNTIIRDKGDNIIVNDPERFDIVKRMWQMLLSGNYTVMQILDIANNEFHLRTRTTKKYKGKSLGKAGVYRLFSNRFYAGYSDNEENKKGNHEAMISDEEYERAQVILGKKGKPKPKKHSFAFTGLMKCGSCGAMITAEIKTKRQKNGNTHTYIFYHCTKRIDKNCAERSVRLESLTAQIDTLISGITISERFQQWAIKYLHEVRSNEAQSYHQVLLNKQKRLSEIDTQLNSLLLKYTSAENTQNELITNEDYKMLKNGLVKEKHALETELEAYGKAKEQWMELSERTFNFARYAQIWFQKGDLQTKRAIFSCLGSNLLIKDQKLVIDLHMPFKFIFENLKKAEQELIQVRTDKGTYVSRQNVSFMPESITMRKR